MKNNELLFCQALDLDIHLTNERTHHILTRHPELIKLKKEFYETILLPDFILKKVTGEYLLIKWYPSIFNGKFLIVAIKPDPDRYWIITSYLSNRMPGGELL